MQQGYHVLFWIVCRVGEDSWVEPMLDAIAAANDNTMLVRFKKLVIKQDLPLLMVEFPVTVRRAFSSHTFPVCKIFD